MTPRTVGVSGVARVRPHPEEAHDAVYDAVCAWANKDAKSLCDSVWATAGKRGLGGSTTVATKTTNSPVDSKKTFESPKGLEGSVWADRKDKTNVYAGLIGSITAKKSQSGHYHSLDKPIQGAPKAQSVFSSAQSATLRTQVIAPKAQDTVPGSQSGGPDFHGGIGNPNAGNRNLECGIRDSDSGGGSIVASIKKSTIHKAESVIRASGSGGGDLDANKCNSHPTVHKFHVDSRNSSSGIPDFHFDSRPSPPNTSSTINNPNFQTNSEPTMVSKMSSPAASLATSTSKSTKLGVKNYEGNTGVRSPQDFLADWRETDGLIRKGPFTHRSVVFVNVPDWANLSDILCLVSGGAIERIWSEHPNQVTVRFLKEDDCKEYYEHARVGIRIDDDLIDVEMIRCEQLSKEVEIWVEKGATRVVQIDVPNEKTFQDLHDLAKGLELDHLEYHVEPNKPGRAYFFFCSVMAGRQMMKNLLLQSDWLSCDAQFIEDPCKVRRFRRNLRRFHRNTRPAPRMMEAEVELD